MPTVATTSGEAPSVTAPRPRRSHAHVGPTPTLESAADIAALLAVGWALWHLSGTNGGIDLVNLSRVGWIVLAAAPVAALELRRLSAPVAWVLGLWGIGGLASLAFALFHTDFVAPTILYGVMPVVALLTMRLWRRPWGPAVLGGLLVVTFFRSWWGAFLAWVGSVLSPEIRDQWLALSWHNQSAVLMGAYGVLFTGVAVSVRSRAVAVSAGIGAGTAFAGAWLAGSRGALVATAAGLITVLLVRRGRRPLLWIGVVLATVAFTVALSHLPGTRSAEQAIFAKTFSASESTSARFDHMAAALQMFLDRPLTGQGIGAYRLAAPSYIDPGASGTSYAHNEFAELFAEGGLLFGIAGVAVLIGLGVAVTRALRRGDAFEESGSLRRPLLFGAVGATVVLTLHAAVDFDWLFPLLGVLFAVTGAVAYASMAPTPTRTGAPAWMLPTAVLLAVGLVATRF